MSKNFKKLLSIICSKDKFLCFTYNETGTDITEEKNEVLGIRNMPQK